MEFIEMSLHAFFYKQWFFSTQPGRCLKKSFFGLKFCLSVAYFMTVEHDFDDFNQFQ